MRTSEEEIVSLALIKREKLCGETSVLVFPREGDKATTFIGPFYFLSGFFRTKRQNLEPVKFVVYGNPKTLLRNWPPND